MRCARPTPPRTTRATVRFGSSLSPPVTSLAAALTAALVAEPASRPAGKQQPCCTSKSPRLTAGGFFLYNPENSGRRAETYTLVRFCRSVLEHRADLLNDRAVRSGTSSTATTSSRNSSGSVRRECGEGLPRDQSLRVGIHVGRKRRNPIQDIERSPPRCIDNVRTRPVIQQVSNKRRILGSSGDVERSHSFVG